MIKEKTIEYCLFERAKAEGIIVPLETATVWDCENNCYIIGLTYKKGDKFYRCSIRYRDLKTLSIVRYMTKVIYKGLEE